MMQVRCLKAAVIDGARRACGETFELRDPRLIDGVLRSGFAEPAAAGYAPLAPRSSWIRQWRKA